MSTKQPTVAIALRSYQQSPLWLLRAMLTRRGPSVGVDSVNLSNKYAVP